jgi:predicted PhzF superfamily epimerase YddE/YHI9
MNSDIQLSTIAVFSKGQLLGNQAAVGIFGESEIHAVSSQSLQRFNEVALCLINPDHTTSISDSVSCYPRYRIRCFSSKGPINFCGHGLMAAAHRLFSLEDFSSPIALLSGKQWFIAERKPQGIRLFCPRIATQPHRTPKNIGRCFDTKPQTVACAQGTQGYWIFNFADGTDLSKLQINHPRLKHFGKRAIIVTSLFHRKKAGRNAICHMRYFAPQYGAREDQATGSACIVIADFWQKKLKKNRFTIIQQSKNGGFMTIECSGNTIILEGDTHTIERQADNFIDLQ